MNQPDPGYAGVSQAGAQDFGLFRKILESGAIPAPSTIDDLGFFAEHKLEYPKPECGEDICLHPMLGVAGNMLTGSTCTLLQLGMNTPIDPKKVERRPLDLVLAIDVSGSMQGEPIAYLREGLDRMIPHLSADDHVTLVAFSTEAEVLIEANIPIDSQALAQTFAGLVAGGGTNIYDGLFTAFQIAAEHQVPEREARVVLLSDGEAKNGLTSVPKMRSLASAYAKLGIGLTTIGVGDNFDVALMRGIAEVGAGNFYFLDDPKAVVEVFTEEVKTFLTPLALDVRIEVAVADAYAFGDAHGTNGWTRLPAGGIIEIPSLFLAGRLDAQAPVDTGRRGGGGAIILELIPKLAAMGSGPGEVGTIFMTWTDPKTGEKRSQQHVVAYDHAVGEFPGDGFFSSPTVDKGFVMLNLYTAFRMAAELVMDGDVGSAIGVLQTVQIATQGWLETHDDPDIDDDLAYVDLFAQNLAKVPGPTPVNLPPEPWPYD